MVEQGKRQDEAVVKQAESNHVTATEAAVSGQRRPL